MITCLVCGRSVYRTAPKQKFCSKPCYRSARRARMRGNQPASELELSPLNVAVSAAYAACLAGRTHRAGTRETSYRLYGIEEMRMPICDTCDVPVVGHMVTFSLKTKVAA